MFVNEAILARGQDPEALFAFFHTQRTGGSNFQRWLRQHFADEVVYSPRTVEKFVHWQKMSDFSVLDRFKVFAGFGEYRNYPLGRPLVALATIRHPFYRIVSLYKMSRSHPTHFLHDVAAAESFENFYRIGSQRKAWYFHNLTSRRIGGGGNASFDQAVANMKRDFGMVIPTNDLFRGSEIMLERFPWKIKPMEKKNALPDAQNYQAFDASPVKTEIMANNQEDERLYDYVVRGAHISE